MNKFLHRWKIALRSVLYIPNLEQDMKQMKMLLEEQKVLLEEQELRTVSTLALLANHQQQLGEQIEELRQLLVQQSRSTTDVYINNNEQCC